MIQKEKAAIVSAIVATAVSVLGIATLVGRPVHVVELVTLFAGGFGSGASVATAIAAHRRRREASVASMACDSGTSVDICGPIRGNDALRHDAVASDNGVAESEST